MNPDRRAVADAAKGWLRIDEAEVLHRWAQANPGPIVEIGSYCGKSAVWLGDAAERKRTVLWAVDPHRGNPEMKRGGSCHDPDVCTGDVVDTFPLFRATIEAAELTGTVIPVVAESVTVAAHWWTKFALVFIDGDHGPAVHEDFRAWAPLARVLAFHDADNGEPRKAVSLAVDSGWRRVAAAGSLVVLTK